MTDPLPAAVRAIDPVLLSEVARQAVRAATFELRDWSVTALRHEKLIETTGGLFRYRGRVGTAARAGLVGYIEDYQRPDEGGQDPPGIYYWRREVLAYQTGLLARLPSGGALAALLRGERIREGSLDLAGEYPWGGGHRQAAGLGNSGSPAGRAAPGQFRGHTWVGFRCPATPGYAGRSGAACRRTIDGGRALSTRLRPVTPGSARWYRLCFRSRSGAGAAYLGGKMATAAYERLPRVFCHNDAHRRNLTLRAPQDQAVAQIWPRSTGGSAGRGRWAVTWASFRHQPGPFRRGPGQRADIRVGALAGYLAGLRDAGWQGDAELARVGYLISLALYWGGTLPHAAVQLVKSPVDVVAKYGRPVEAVLEGWRALAGLALDRADEARKII